METCRVVEHGGFILSASKAKEVWARVLQDKLDVQSKDFAKYVQSIVSHELDTRLDRLWDRLRRLHACGHDSGSDSSSSSDRPVLDLPENLLGFVAPHVPHGDPHGDPLLEEDTGCTGQGARPGSELPELPRLRRRSAMGGNGLGRTSQTGAAEIRHSLLHSVAELDAQHAQQAFRQSVLAMLVSPTLNQTDSWAVEHERPTRFMKLRSTLQRKVLETTWFEGLVVCCIGLNTVLIGIASDWNLQHIHEEEPKHFRVAERVFAVIFALELFARMFAYGPAFFWRMVSWPASLISVFFWIFRGSTSLAQQHAQ